MRRHWLGTLVGLCVLGLASSGSHAATINAHGVFDVTYRGNADVGIVDPPYEGSGFFTVHENDVTEFGFSILGFTWDEGDAGTCLCSVTQGGELTLRLVFSDQQGFGFLTWMFPEETFDFILMADPYELHGSTGADSASGVFRSFDFTVSEPGALLTFSMGLGLLLFGRSFAAK